MLPSIFSSTVWGPFPKVEWPFQWVFYFSKHLPFFFPFFLWYLTGTTEKKNMEQVFRPLDFNLHPPKKMIFFIPYRLHLFQLSLNICNAQSCLSPHVSQYRESWSPKILLLLGTSSSLLQMGLLVLHIRISHKSHLNHFVVMANMMSKLSAPL
jgi:hypothetical protein